MPKWVDRTGIKYGMLTATEYLGHKQWLCVCDCGNTCIREGGKLKPTSSCGCQKERQRSEAGRKRATHGDSRTKLYKRWTAMIQRCENPNNTAYGNYGGRGISVCDEWHDYGAFKEWAIANGFDESLTIDRIDVNGDYEPSNCRWVDYSVQMSNRRHYNRKELWKAVEAIDESGNVIERFKCVDDAIKWLGGKTKAGTGISKVLHGEQATAYGYQWRMADVQG